MAGPTYVGVYSATATSDTTATTTLAASITAGAGDLLLLSVVTGQGHVVPQSVSGGGLTWTKHAANPTDVAADAEATIFTATSPTAQTFTATVTVADSSSGHHAWNWQCQRWSNAQLTGNFWTAAASTSGQLSITTSAANVALAMVVSDYNTVSGASRTYVTASAGAFTETYYATLGSGTDVAYCGYYANAGAAGAKTVGLSAPTGMSAAIVVAEVAAATTASISTLADTFATQDATKWNYAGTAAVVSGQLSLTCDTSYNNYVKSTGAYDLTGSAIYAQLAQAPASTGETWLAVTPDSTGTNSVKLGVQSGNLVAVRYVGGTSTSLASVAYSATSHKWLRIRHASGTVYCDTSPDGSTWTQQASWAPTFAVTSMYAAITSGASTGSSTALWDNVNTVPTETHSGSAALSGSGRLTLAGSPRLKGSLARSGSGVLALSGSGSSAIAYSGSVVLSGSGVLALAYVPPVNYSGTVALASEGTLTVSGSDSTRFVFRGPIYQRRYPVIPPVTALINYSKAVLRIAGEWVETEWPTAEQVDAADIYLPGGHEIEVDAATASELSAAGYTVEPVGAV